MVYPPPGRRPRAYRREERPDASITYRRDVDEVIEGWERRQMLDLSDEEVQSRRERDGHNELT